MFVDEPYFMQNEDWYYFSGKSRKYEIYNNVPDEVKQSYEEFYKEITNY